MASVASTMVDKALVAVEKITFARQVRRFFATAIARQSIC